MNHYEVSKEEVGNEKDALTLWGIPAKIDDEEIAFAISKMKASYQEYLEMSKHKSGYPAVGRAIDAAKNEHDGTENAAQNAVANQERSAGAESGIVPSAEQSLDLDAGHAPGGSGGGEHPAKKARKKPDRTNPPHYEIHSKKADGSDSQLEAVRDTASKALKYVFARSVECARDGRAMFVVRCKLITMDELMKE